MYTICFIYLYVYYILCYICYYMLHIIYLYYLCILLNIYIYSVHCLYIYICFVTRLVTHYELNKLLTQAHCLFVWKLTFWKLYFDILEAPFVSLKLEGVTLLFTAWKEDGEISAKQQLSVKNCVHQSLLQNPLFTFWPLILFMKWMVRFGILGTGSGSFCLKTGIWKVCLSLMFDSMINYHIDNSVNLRYKVIL